MCVVCGALLQLMNDLLTFVGPLLLKATVTWLANYRGSSNHQGGLTLTRPDDMAHAPPRISVASQPVLLPWMGPNGTAGGSPSGSLEPLVGPSATPVLLPWQPGQLLPWLWDPESPQFGCVCVALLCLTCLIKAFLNSHYEWRLVSHVCGSRV